MSRKLSNLELSILLSEHEGNMLKRHARFHEDGRSCAIGAIDRYSIATKGRERLGWVNRPSIASQFDAEYQSSLSPEQVLSMMAPFSEGDTEL